MAATGNDAHLTSAIVDVHTDEPEFGYRFNADSSAGLVIWSARTGCTGSAASGGSSRRRPAKAARRWAGTQGVAVYDDLVQREFSTPASDLVWLTDITEHPTGEGKLDCCASKNVFPNGIVGSAIDDRMTTQLAVGALRQAIARRRPTAPWS